MQMFVQRSFIVPGRAGRSVGRLHIGNRIFPCVLGHGGIVARKREGDGATPRGSLIFVSGYFRQDRIGRIKTSLPMAALRSKDGWCDDVLHRSYNRKVALPFEGRHECMWRNDRLYDVVIVLDYNISPRVRGFGSAIFFHVCSPDSLPTEGCIAVRPDDLRKILPFVRPGTRISVG